MNTGSETEILVPLSKGKLILLTIGGFAFAAVCVWLWTIADDQVRRDPTFVRVIAVVGAFFFGLCGIFGAVKMFDRKPGMIIDYQGIVDNSSMVSAGRVPWEDILGFRVTSTAGQRFLTIDLADPQRYASRGNFLQRRLNASNVKLVGSPLNISSNTLKIDLDKLSQILSAKLEDRVAERNR